MIRRLRRRFMLAAMLSLLLVLGVIMGSLNALNYRRIAAQADTTLALLTEGGGKFPAAFSAADSNEGWGEEGKTTRPTHDDERPREGEQRPSGRPVSPELPFISRYFSVSYAADGSVIATDTSRIAAVDEATAVAMADAVRTGSRPRGYSGQYRFARTAIAGDAGHEGGVRVIFLDCERELATFRSFLSRSCLLSVIGLAAVFVLIALFSVRVVRPIAESYEKQRRFITDAGHELKTPLTVIDADAELLGMEVGEENEWLCDIRRQTARLSRLTADLIYLSRLDEARSGSVLLEFPLSDVVAETAQSFAAPAATRGLVLSLAVEPMLSLTGDESAIRQLVSILLDNAVKYAPAGSGIALALRRSGRSITLAVTNPAPELTAEQLAHLFDRFYRADPARTSPGHGLGLSIARAIADTHKARLTAAVTDDRLTVSAVFPA